MKRVAVLTGKFFGDVQSEILQRPIGFAKEGEMRRQLRLLYEGTAALVS